MPSNALGQRSYDRRQAMLGNKAQSPNVGYPRRVPARTEMFVRCRWFQRPGELLRSVARRPNLQILRTTQTFLLLESGCNLDGFPVQLLPPSLNRDHELLAIE